MRGQFAIAIAGLKRGAIASAVILPVIASVQFGRNMADNCEQEGIYSASVCFEAVRAGIRHEIMDVMAPSFGRYLAEREPAPREKSIVVTSSTLDMG